MRKKERRKELNARFRHAAAIALKKYRESNEISQAQLAQNLHISVRSYSDLEHGISSPSAMTMVHFLLLMEKEEQKEFLEFLKDALEKDE